MDQLEVWNADQLEVWYADQLEELFVDQLEAWNADQLKELFVDQNVEGNFDQLEAWNAGWNEEVIEVVHEVEKVRLMEEMEDARAFHEEGMAEYDLDNLVEFLVVHLIE